MRALIVILAVALAISIVSLLIGGANVGGLLTGAVVGGGEDPLVAFKYALEIEGKLSGWFTSASGIGSESEVLYERIENAETREKTLRANLGSLSWTPVTLKRQITSDRLIWDWRQMVIDGNIDAARTNCSIIAYDQNGEEVARWNLVNAWPSSVIGPVMDESGTSYMVEQVILVHEGMERVN
jgi:phage tail-like protein